MFKELALALVITKREMRDQFRDWRIIFPVVGLTVFFPFLMNITAQAMLNFVNKYGASLIGERLVPFLFMVVGFFPISVSLVIALESFVGEKERGSIEPLLNSPLKDWQLYLGKLLSSTAPPLFASFLGMAVYTTGLLITHVPVPALSQILQIILLTIVQAIVMVAGAVVVSSQATSVRAANLLASFIIIPMALVIQGEAIILFWGDYSTLWWAVAGMAILAVLLIRVGVAHFQREELLGKEIDVLNLKWGWKVFKRSFTGEAKSFKEWYLKVLPVSIRGMRLPSLLVLGVFIAAVWIGAQLATEHMIPLPAGAKIDVKSALGSLPGIYPLFSVGSLLAILWQNVRTLVIAMLLGLISFGIFGLLLVMVTMVVAGFGVAFLLGYHLVTPLSVFGIFLPHGLLEIPAIILAMAAVLRSGAVLATPDSRKTIGEVWIMAIADWAKIMVGVVIPLLIIGAALEAWVTLPFAPRLFM
jgi:uncharacterized membrane protein SpoIIM required for sporulation/ABC-type transport system involved in multi-copper enzyme maturation permease subunit